MNMVVKAIQLRHLDIILDFHLYEIILNYLMFTLLHVDEYHANL